MSSTNIVNFSLRQNKCIERAITFDCIGLLMNDLHIDDAVYVGFGSLWFEDFDLAHRLLGIQTMISIEYDSTVFKRALFNRPYRTVEVLQGDSAEVLPSLLERDELSHRPWLVWLDYDKEINEERLDELVTLVQDLPPNSFLLTTFSAMPNRYGRPFERPERIRRLFGDDTVPEELSQRECKDESRLAHLLGQATEDLLLSRAIRSGRPGSFVPSVNLAYKDSVPMVTVGGLLPAPEKYDSARELIDQPNWPGRIKRLIETPPLTTKEIQALQSMLPSETGLTRQDLAEIGFDLEETQLASYVDHYLRYPRFAQVAR